MSDPEGNSFGKHQNSRENKTYWFPEGADIKCFLIFLNSTATKEYAQAE